MLIFLVTAIQFLVGGRFVYYESDRTARKRRIERGARVRRARLETVLYHAMMIVITFAFVFPALWAVSMSLRTNENMFSPDQLIPHPITFEHYARLFEALPDLLAVLRQHARDRGARYGRNAAVELARAASRSPASGSPAAVPY